MYKIILTFAIIAALGVIDNAYSQEVQIATFQETAQVLVDRTLTGNITASVTLQTTSNQEIKISDELSQTILENPRIVSVILTNFEGCGVLGVTDKNCILVNIFRSEQDTNIILVQNTAKEFGDLVIDDLNEMFDTDAKYHSSYLHHRDQSNAILETSGSVSGNDLVSAIYTMSKEETQSMYQKISALTVNRHIRDSGGFYNTANALATYDNSYMSLSIIPIQKEALYQIRVSAEYPDADKTDTFSPLDYLQVKEINRSEYFANGFYPLNSIFQIIILSPQQVKVHDLHADIIPTQKIDGQTIPTEFTKNGWVFDNLQGIKIEGKYLFGTQTSVSSEKLSMKISDPTNIKESDFDESIAIVAIIVVFTIAAAGFYLKGYRTSKQ